MAESITQKTFMRDGRVTIQEFVCVSDTDGSLTSTPAKNRDGDNISFKGEIVKAVEYIPGTPGPTNGVADITLTTSGGVDILGGDGANISATVANMIPPKANSVNWDFPLFGTLTLALANNAVDSAVFTIRVYFIRATDNL